MAIPSFRVTALRRRENHPNLIGAWNFNEGSGTTARDSLGLNIPLTLDASVTWVAGHTGASALSNSGAGSAHRTGWAATLHMTMMCWARPTDLTANQDRAILGIWDTLDTSGSTKFAIWAERNSYGTPNILQGNVRNGGLASINGPALTVNVWTHVALTYDGTNIGLYKDGVQVAFVNNVGTMDTGAYNLAIAPSPSYVEVDDVRIFNTALTTAEIAAFMGDPVAAP